MFQDVWLNHLEDTVKTFDHIIDGIMKPLVDAVNENAKVFQKKSSYKNALLKDMFAPFVSAVRNIPILTENFYSAVVQLFNVSHVYCVSNLVDMQSNMERTLQDARDDGLTFFSVSIKFLI